MADPASQRREQTFPTLSPEDIERIRRFGHLRNFNGGEQLYAAGTRGAGMYVLIDGRVRITRRDGLGHVALVVEQGPGQFLAEIGQLAGRPALVDGHALGPVEALLVEPERLRALMVAEADLGERIMRALILRRVGLIETGAGLTLVGSPADPDMVRLRSFLARNGQPHVVFDPADDTDAAALVASHPQQRDALPWAVCPNGGILFNPTIEELAECAGMVTDPDPDRIYDVVVVGAGPAGLATAVYAASEGLSVRVFDSRAFGGQAGASARIENYLGFPTGITGQALMARAFNQAQKFGTEFAIPTHVTSMSRGGDGLHRLALDGHPDVRARTVVVASGARYRRPTLPDLERHEGRGVWYWASAIEARMAAGREVVIVGGGNSAGQAAVFLAASASRVHVVIRGPGLAASMSSYLIERIAAQPNIELHTRSEIVAIESGENDLRSVTWANRDTGATQTHPVAHVFLFIGADPATEWLGGCGVATDDRGFVVTGSAADDERSDHETSVPGIFAIGDVRAGSVKRVGAAIGEGATVVAEIHAHLASLGSGAVTKAVVATAT
ncbi:FAD-dependent oxidoreductase [Lysobacter sp. HA35]